MTHFLQSALGVKEDDRLFRIGLIQLEKMTGSSGVDTRLIADIIEKAHKVMRRLGLDIRDTTAHELYFTLSSAVKHNTAESLLADNDYVLLIVEDQAVSFNLIDVIENAHHELPYDKRIISHGQRNLRGELVGRYINHARTDEVTARDIASRIGLLPDEDAWYTDNKHKNKQTEEPK
jgi:hypothetical protein